MKLIGKKVILKNFEDGDINEYYEWYTSKTEWQKWDAPWIERKFDKDLIIEKSKFNELLSPVVNLEIYTIDNKHIGWVNSYYMDEEYTPVEEKTNKIAIGIDIPNDESREKGNGTEALELFIEYFKENGVNELYIQTWSGNHRMIKVAEKLGFSEVNRYKDKRIVNEKKYDALTYKRKI